MYMDWESSSTSILLNPRLSQTAKADIERFLPITGDFGSHFWILTSGTTRNENQLKCVALSKHAVLTSAAAVNRHLFSTAADIWINPLPLFHVGGLGILARGYLSGAKAVNFEGKWCPDQFYRLLIEHKATLTALVPTQLYDLVVKSLHAPPSLRAVIIGGDRLDEALYQRAIALGWKILPSYGLSEAASQVATAGYASGSTSLEILDHITTRIEGSGHIALQGDSLLTAYAYIGEDSCTLMNPKQEGWLVTEDKGSMHGNTLSVHGRNQDFIKIGGESVQLARLNNLLDAIKSRHRSYLMSILVALPDSRLGHALHLAVEGSLNEETIRAISQFQEEVLPFEKIRKIHEVEAFPRTDLGKVHKKALADLMTR